MRSPVDLGDDLVYILAMFAWLRRLFAGPGAPGPDPLTTVFAELESPEPWGFPRTQRWAVALDALSSDPPRWREQLPELRARIALWYAAHPFEIVWSRDHAFRVREPLGLTTDDLVHGQDAPNLVPWATLARTLEFHTGGRNLFHHGCSLRDVLAVLRDPAMPERVELFALPSVVEHRPHEVDGLVRTLCDAPCFAGLAHLVLRTAVRLEPRHIERLATAPWAAGLRTLDLGETMADWSVDVPDEPRHAALRALSRLRSLTHLVLINGLGPTSDLEALLESPFPALTHLNLGSGLAEAGALELLASTRSLPAMQELCFAGGPARGDPAWDLAAAAAFPIYLYGVRVTADYPARG